MNIFTGDLGAAERIYINQGSPDEAVRTYPYIFYSFHRASFKKRVAFIFKRLIFRNVPPTAAV
jgi:hypothetical protein